MNEPDEPDWHANFKFAEAARHHLRATRQAHLTSTTASTTYYTSTLPSMSPACQLGNCATCTVATCACGCHRGGVREPSRPFPPAPYAGGLTLDAETDGSTTTDMALSDA